MENLIIQVDLHEWLPDLGFRYSTEEESFKAHWALKTAKGCCPMAWLL
jgi:hypothetical protein